ncbi:protein FAR1-RELATED SEQUENCE 5-like [Arachis hypogaea]|uniref:protein FAR1-RELATED SEQUENCE 5-like n=1 Tax=Arachis hypogaea TaxID=3818 RepID=UPI003B213C6D
MHVKISSYLQIDATLNVIFLLICEQEEELGDELDGEEIFEELTDYDYDDAYGLDSIDDLLKLDFLSIGEVEVDKFHFGTLPIAFEFYNRFVKESRKREPKTETRTGCGAQFQVKFVGVTGRWHVTRFSNVHNHELLEGRLSRLLPGHRSMSKAEIALMNNMRKSEISTSQVYALLASQSGGFDKLNYGVRDMSNQIAKVRREIPENVGVNHHNQTVVFAACIVIDETDETYIWVLQQFLETMNGRAPSSVFPGDYEIPLFRSKWQTLVEEFGVEKKEWLNEIYEKCRSWTTCYIREKFFAEFRITSRCEGLHSLIGKYTKPHYNLSEFIEHFQRMLGHMRFREFYAEYESARGVPVMQTCIELLEMCATDTYTREVFFLFRHILVQSGAMRVVDYQTRDNSITYYVCRYAKPTNVWEVKWVDNVRRDVREIPPGHNKTSFSKYNENAFNTQDSSAPQTNAIYDGEGMDNVKYEN